MNRFNRFFLFALAGLFALSLANCSVDGSVSSSDGSVSSSSSSQSNTPPTILFGSATVTLALNQPFGTIPAVTGTPLTSCTVSPALPAGLNIDNATCQISGTPTAITASAAYIVTATNSVGSGTATINIAVTGTVVSPNVVYGDDDLYLVTNETIGVMPLVTGTPLTSCTVNPALPAGLSIDNATCAISGTPTATSTSTTYTITATNSEGSDTTSIYLEVVSSAVAPNIGNQGPSPYLVGKEMYLNFYPSGTALTSCTVSPALPAGLSINNTTCQVSGTPASVAAKTSYTVTATNSAGSDSATLTFGVYNIALESFSYSGTGSGASGKYAYGDTISVNFTMASDPVPSRVLVALAGDTVEAVKSGNTYSATITVKVYNITQDTITQPTLYLYDASNEFMGSFFSNGANFYFGVTSWIGYRYATGIVALGITVEKGNLPAPGTQAVTLGTTWHSLTVDGDKWYSFDATSGTQYTVAWDDSFQGTGSFTLDVKVSAYYADGTPIFENKDSGYNSPQSFTSASSGTIYVKIAPYTSGSTGTVGLQVNTYTYTPPTTQGTLAIDNTFHGYTINEVQWYEFSATSGTQYLVAWDDSYDGSGSFSADVEVSAYYADGTPIFENKDSGYNSPQSFTSASSGTIYVKISPAFGTGTVGVKVSTP